MKTWIQTLLLFLVLLLGNQNTCIAHANDMRPGMAEDGGTSGYSDDEKSKDRIYEDTIEPAQRQTALITDTSQTVRLCNTRPQRILPSFTAKPTHLLSRNTFHNKFYSLQFQGIDRYLTTVTTPIPSSAACDYYVIALRQIIR
ncbi:hypothetical protein ACQRD6_00070 [Prevotella sp. SGI.027]|nr:hypothetical protein [Prevotellaceae bacterium]MDY5843305.1 hypothetical protein [Prevotella sp.]